MSPITTRSSVYATPTHNRYGTSRATKSALKSNRLKEDATNKQTLGVFLRLKPVGNEVKSLFKMDDQQVRAVPPDSSVSKVYKFTHIFEAASQSEVFNRVGKPVVEDFVTSAKDGLIFTYGNTGSGKTYTMEGNRKDPGLIYRTIDFLFNSIGSQQTVQNLIGKVDPKYNRYCILDHKQTNLYPDLHINRVETPSGVSRFPSAAGWLSRTKETGFVSVDPDVYYCVFVSLFELHQRQINDLFKAILDQDINKPDSQCNRDTRKRLDIMEDPEKKMRYLANAVEFEVKSADEAVEFYRRGIQLRKTNSTKLNNESSRSHCVFNLKLVQVKKSYDGEFDPDSLVSSQLSLVDLAGSERAKRTGATGATLGEAGRINNSLGTLRRCIEGLRDREAFSSIPYRDDNLTRLFQSYLEGRGLVNMILCVNPTAEDFNENNEAMKFGVHTQDVAVDLYPSPAKRPKSRHNTDFAILDFDMNMDDEQFLDKLIADMEKRRLRRKIDIETVFGAQDEVRKSIERKSKENVSLKQEYENQSKDLRFREEQIKRLVDETEQVKDLKQTVGTLQRDLSKKNRQIQRLQSKENLLAKEIENAKSENQNLRREFETLLETEEFRIEKRKSLRQFLSKVTEPQWSHSSPSAPKLGPLQSSSPVDIPNPSTTETTESHSPPATTNSSTEAIEFQERAPRSRNKSPLMKRTASGVPVSNPRHNRSYSCPGGKVLLHVPKDTIALGTVLQAKCKKAIPVKNLRRSDILHKDAAAYSIVHQNADDNGDVETSVYKGKIIPTVSEGVQVIFDDIETMRQVSPKRKRPARDAQYTH